MVGTISPASAFAWSNLSSRLSCSQASMKPLREGFDKDCRWRLLASARSKTGSSNARLGGPGSDGGDPVEACLLNLGCGVDGSSVEAAVSNGVGREGSGSSRICLVVGWGSKTSSSRALLRDCMGLEGSTSGVQLSILKKREQNTPYRSAPRLGAVQHSRKVR